MAPVFDLDDESGGGEVCANCGAASAPAVCSGCRRVRYCGLACQRSAWKSGHRSACQGKEDNITETNEFPIRCPIELISDEATGALRSLPRLERLDSRKAQDMLCQGKAFVAPMQGLLRDNLLKWDFQYLAQHLPREKEYGVMLDEGSGKIVMSHTARNGLRQVDPSNAMDRDASSDGQQQHSENSASDASCPFAASDQARMTFAEFQDEARRFQRHGKKGKLPYFGIHLLWRLNAEDNGFVGDIDEDMQDDLWSIRFDLIKEWQESNVLPLIQRFYLFAGLGGTLYHCHYDLQPNLHVQLTGRKRFILFPPDEWVNLYPFPVHHDLDRRAMVDLDSPDSCRFPNWVKARGYHVELGPGDALYIPPYWWHHVQSLTPETTSMAMWFFELFPLSPKVHYGLSPRAEKLALMRDIEELIGRNFPDAAGEEDCTKSRPQKAAQVAGFMRWWAQDLGLKCSENRGVDESIMSLLLRSRQDVAAMATQLVVERLNLASSDAARSTLEAFLRRRF